MSPAAEPPAEGGPPGVPSSLPGAPGAGPTSTWRGSWQVAVSLSFLSAAGLALVAARRIPPLFAGPQGSSAVLPGSSAVLPGSTALLLGTAAAAAVLALHRPMGGLSLGLGCAALPALANTFGAAPTALGGAAALALAELARRFLEQRVPYGPPERRRRLRVLVSAARLVLALVAAFLLAHTSRLPELWQLVVAALLCSHFVVALEAVEQLVRGRVASLRDLSFWPPILYDLVGWGIGIAIVQVAARAASAPVALWLLLILCVPALEATRGALLAQALEQRSGHLQSLGAAGQRMAGSGNEIGRLAEQVRAEVLRVLPFSWFHFERLGEAEDHRHWRSGPDGLLEEGRPNPGPYPPPLPGVHRRSNWRLIDRELRSDGRPLARLRLWCDPRRLSPEALELFALLLPQLAASVERTVLNREARQDPLTGLAHRRVLDAELELACAQLRAGGAEPHEPFALVLCDLDHFKAINDSWGHPTGDQALRHVARILGRAGRESDLCSRFGGEEFALLLRGADGPRALAVAERVRREVATSVIETTSGQLRVTLSAGAAAALPGAVPERAALVARADAALYAAKRAGRNRCLLAAGNHFRSIDGETVLPAAAPSAEAHRALPGTERA